MVCARSGGQVKAGVATGHPTVHRTAKNYPAPNINSAEAERPDFFFCLPNGNSFIFLIIKIIYHYLKNQSFQKKTLERENYL